MSFFYTQQQVRDRTKDVTRRDGWADLKPGQLFWAVEKSQGLGKGGKIKRITLCRCVTNHAEPLRDLITDPEYGQREARREGFPHLTGEQFAEMFIGHMGGDLDKRRNRIAFSYVTDPVTIREARGAKRRKAVAHA